MRSSNEWEFVVGPCISETGHGMTLAVGRTARVGRMALPVDLGVTSTDEGPRYSLTFGWNIGRWEGAGLWVDSRRDTITVTGRGPAPERRLRAILHDSVSNPGAGGVRDVEGRSAS